MTGLEKIINEIGAESSKVVAERIEQAEKEAAQIMKDAQKEATVLMEKIAGESSHRLVAAKSAAESAASLRKRRLLLEEKQKLIKEVIEDAKKDVLSLPSEQYFKLLLKLIEDHATDEEGIIFLNEKDAARLPENFATKVNAIAVKKGGKLILSKEARPIDGGFILVYEGIDRNCSISSIFETNMEVLQDKIQKLLF